MKLLSLLLSATGVSALVWVSPVVAQTELANISKNATDLSLILKDTPSDKGTPMRGQAASHIAQGETRVTGVEVVPTESGLELILKTAAGSERLVPLIVPEESDLVIDILDATLAFSIRNGVTEVDPAPGIERITVTQADSNSIQVRITGTEQTPSAEVVAGRDDLVLSITPETTTAEEEQEIDIIATGQVEEDTYRVENSNRTGTRTDTPLRDIPQSIQVVPRKVIEDQSINRIGDALRNVSGIGVTRDFGGTNFTFSARGFNDTRILRNGIRSGEDDSPIGTSPTTVDSIEVLKGPGSVLFGIAEPGGVINIITKQPEKEASYDFKFRVGSFDFFEPSIDLAGPLTDDKKLTYRFNVSYQSDGLFRDFVESEALVVAPVLRYEFDDKTDLTFEYEYQQDTRTFDDGIQAFDGFDPFAAPDELFLGEPDNVLDDGVHRFFLTLNHRFNESVRLRSAFGAEVSNESIAAYRTFPFFNFDPETGDIFDRFFQSTPNLASNTFSFQTDLITEFETGPVEHELVAGFDVTFAFVGIEGANIGNTFTSINVFDPVYDDEFPPNLPATTILDLETEEDFVGFFLQDLITLTPKLKLLAGGRFDFAFANSNTFVDN
ncbi:MAG: TonB-dependent receptor, partial [Cyanobacteria bacterium J06558_2]